MFFLLFIFLQEYCKKWIEWYHETRGVENKFKCGEPRITAEEEDKAIVDSIKQNHKQTSINIKCSLGLACSTRSIIRRFNAAGYKHHIPALKSNLQEHHKQ